MDKSKIIIKSFWFNKELQNIVKKLTADDIKKIEKYIDLHKYDKEDIILGYELGFIAGYAWKKEGTNDK